MEYTEEQLGMMETLGAELTPVEELGVLLGLPTEAVADDIHTEGSEARTRYLRGLYRTANIIRRRNLELAEQLVPTAMAMCNENMKKAMSQL